MCRQPIARNTDLTHLVDDGYALEIDRDGVLLVNHVPYVTPERRVKRGTIVFRLTTAGSIDDVVGFPDHTAFFMGEIPCDDEGRPLTKIVVGSQQTQLTTRVAYDHYFSSKPGPEGYSSMYAQVRQYVMILESYAQRLEPGVTARIGPRLPPTGEESDTDHSPFVYADTASVRAGIVMATANFLHRRIGIVGLGGTGSYVLDQVAKTPVSTIDLYDDDVFLTHNAFRGPGAATLEELREMPSKVTYWQRQYCAMHNGIVPHPYRITSVNAGELDPCDFVFLCMDSGPEKLAIVIALEAR